MKLSLLNLRTHSNIQTQKNNITKPQVVQIQDNEIQNHNLLNEINAASMNSRYITQSSLKEIASSNVNGQKVYQNFRSKYISTVQRAVPRYNNEHPHAVAETGS